jgi:oligopeptide/dipeptide ABC transporter ATP-binding protein
MYAGQIVEEADVFTLFDDPRHPYTKGLLEAVTALREDTDHLDTIPGVVPNLLHLPEGCRFHPRCALCSAPCKMSSPEMREISPGHRARCISI